MSERYRVEPTGKGFWPYCVRAGNGTRDLYVGHKKTCDRVAAELTTAFRDGEFVGKGLYDALAAETQALREQVKALQSAANSWQSGYDEGRRMGTKHRQSEVEQLSQEVSALRTKLAMAEDAAAKGDAARHQCGGLEMEIHELKTKLAELEKQEPVAWGGGAFHFGGKRDGKLYTQCETEAQIEAYILDMHRSSDSLTLRKGPLYTAPVVQAQPSVPDWWKPVPMEPTTQMTFVGQSLRYDSVNSIGEIYRQMLAVAPSPIDPAAHPQPCQQPQAHPARCGCER